MGPDDNEDLEAIVMVVVVADGCYVRRVEECGLVGVWNDELLNGYARWFVGGVDYWIGVGDVDAAMWKISVHCLLAICRVGGVPVFVHHCRWASHCA